MDIQQNLGACGYLAVFNYAGMGEAEVPGYCPFGAMVEQSYIGQQQLPVHTC